MKRTIQSIIAVGLSAFVLAGCNNKTTSLDTEEKGTVPAVLALENISNLQGEEFLSSITGEIKYIPLETTDESVFGQMSKIAILKSGNLLVTDGQRLLLFNPEGRFIRPVSQMGNGPADYTRINGLAANATTGGFFLHSTKKVIEFDAEGNYVNSFETEDRPMDMVVDAEGRILLHRMNMPKAPEDTTTTWHLFRYDFSGNELKRFANASPRIKKEGVPSILMPMRPLYLFDGEVRFNEIDNDTVFIVGENELLPYTVLDLGAMRMSATPEEGQGDANRIMEELKKKLVLAFLMEDSQYLYMVFGWGFSGEYIYSTYNKQDGGIVNYGNGGFLTTNVGLTNDVDGALPFYPLTIDAAGTRIMWKDAEEFKSSVLELDYETQKAKYGERFEKVWTLANTITDDDNPILIIAE